MLDTRTKVNQMSAGTTQTTKFEMSKNEAKTKQNNKNIYIYIYTEEIKTNITWIWCNF